MATPAWRRVSAGGGALVLAGEDTHEGNPVRHAGRGAAEDALRVHFDMDGVRLEGRPGEAFTCPEGCGARMVEEFGF